MKADRMEQRTVALLDLSVEKMVVRKGWLMAEKMAELMVEKMVAMRAEKRD